MKRIEVFIKPGLVDAVGDGILKDIEDLNIGGVDDVRSIQVYHIDGDVDKAALRRIGAELLADPVSQEFVIGDNEGAASKGAWVVDVIYHPGVTDNVGMSAVKGIRDLGIGGVRGVRTAWRYILRGKVKRADVDSICRRLLANGVIQNYEIKKA